MARLIKLMNDEIKKYQGRIYYLDIRKDVYGNLLTPHISLAWWIKDTTCYDHSSFELHHVIKFTHFEHNKKWFQERRLENCLILIPKVMHQHLENPIYELSYGDFYAKYKIHKYELLFNKNDYFAGKYPTILNSIEAEIDSWLTEWEGAC